MNGTQKELLVEIIKSNLKIDVATLCYLKKLLAARAGSDIATAIHLMIDTAEVRINEMTRQLIILEGDDIDVNSK